MEWTLGILFAASALLLILSIINSSKAEKARQKEIDAIYISNTTEFNEIRELLRKLELDMDIVYKESGIQLSEEERATMREILDLYTRKYSIASIAAKTKLTEGEVRELLAPYIASRGERRRNAQ